MGRNASILGNLDAGNFSPLTFEGYQAGFDRLQQSMQFQQQLKLNQKKDAENQKKQQLVGQKYMQQLLKDKNSFTNTDYDPFKNALMAKILQGSAEHLQAGGNVMDLNILYGEDIARLNDLNTKSKAYKGNMDAFKKEYLSKHPEIDPIKFEQSVKEEMWGSGDLDSVDPDNMGKAFHNAMSKEGVVTSGAMDKYIAQYHPIDERKVDTIEINAQGGRETKYRTAKVSRGYVQGTDYGNGETVFTPDHTIMTDNGKPVIYDFASGNKKIPAPIHLATDEELQMVKRDTQTNALPYVLGVTNSQLKKLEQDGTPLRDKNNNIILDATHPEAETMLKANLYTALNDHAPKTVYNTRETNKTDPYNGSFADFKKRHDYKVAHPIASSQSVNGQGELPSFFKNYPLEYYKDPQTGEEKALIRAGSAEAQDLIGLRPATLPDGSKVYWVNDDYVYNDRGESTPKKEVEKENTRVYYGTKERKKTAIPTPEFKPAVNKTAPKNDKPKPKGW